MAKKKDQSPVFEIFVVLAIVAIVAVTGQVLVNFERTGAPSSFGGDQLTGFAVAEYGEEEAETDFLDVGVKDIVVNPPSPIIGEPFEIRVVVSNNGFTTIKTPYYVEAQLMLGGVSTKPTVLTRVATEILEPGDSSEAVFRVTAVTKEGPLKIIAVADSTAKLDDGNTANNRRSKTVIITSE